MFMLVTPTEVIQDIKKTFDVAVTRTETTTYTKIITGVGSRQVGTGISEIRPSQIAPLSEREGGDDWFALFDITREKPSVAPPGTFHRKWGLCTLSEKNICTRLIHVYVSVSAAVVQPVAEVAAPTKPKPKFIMEDVRPPVTLVNSPQLRVVDDDWFVLLHAPAKVSGILLLWLLL